VKKMTFERFCQMIQELKQKKARCSQYCSCWDDEDKDCEIYGENHRPPSRCQWFLERESIRIDEQEANKEKDDHEVLQRGHS